MSLSPGSLWGVVPHFCRLLLFCESAVPFCLTAPRAPLPFEKHSGFLAKMTSEGSLKLAFFLDTP